MDLPGFQAVLGHHVPRVPERACAQVQQYSMHDLQSPLDKADGKTPGLNHVEARVIKVLPAPVQWLLFHSYWAILRGTPPPMQGRDAHIWLSHKVPVSAELDNYRPIALGQLDMKLLTGPLTQRSWRCSRDTAWSAIGSRGPSRAPKQGPRCSWRSGSSSGEDPTRSSPWTPARSWAPPRTAHSRILLRHLYVPPEVIDLLVFLHTAARLRIATAHGLTQPVHVLRGVRQGSPKAPCPMPLLAEGHRLRPPGEAERGLIQAYIDDLLVVAHTRQHFFERVEVVATYLAMMGMELNPCKCAMAKTEGVPGLHLRLGPHLENPWHWIPAVDCVPYPGLRLQPDGEFSLQRKHRLRLAAVHH